MSYQAVRWVFENSRTESIQRLIMLAIAEHANDKGECWPSLDRIAKYCNVSERRLCRNLAALKKSGELEVVEGGGKGRSNRYRIKMDISNSVPGDTVSAPNSVTNSVTGDRVSNAPNSVTGGRYSVTGGIQTLSPVTEEPLRTNGTTIRAVGARVSPAPDGATPSLPFRSPNFAQAWQDWQAHMKDKKKAIGPTQARAILGHLAKMTEGAAILAIELSIRSGWTAIHQPESRDPRTPAKKKDGGFMLQKPVSDMRV